MQSFNATAPKAALASQGRALAFDGASGVAYLGGANGSSCAYSITNEEVSQATKGDGNAIQDLVLWHKEGKILPVVATASGEVAVLDDGKKTISFVSHSGAASGLALHPSGDLIASVGMDKSIVLHDLSQQREVSRLITDSCQYHDNYCLTSC